MGHGELVEALEKGMCFKKNNGEVVSQGRNMGKETQVAETSYPAIRGPGGVGKLLMGLRPWEKRDGTVKMLEED